MRTLHPSRLTKVVTSTLSLLVLTACSTLGTEEPLTTPTLSQPTAIPPTAELPGATATAIAPTLESPPFCLSEPGPYHVGRNWFSFEDPSRPSRELTMTVWYPALAPEDLTSTAPTVGAPPDTSAAPYPAILSSTKVAGFFAPLLVTHGFVWVSVDGLDTYRYMNNEMFDQPLDILAALNHVGSNQLEGLAGMIDADRAGVIGYSFDGYNTLALSGARIDPQYYLDQCPTPDSRTAEILSGYSSFNCAPAQLWSEFSAQAGADITTSEDGLWRPMTDPRIRAVMPMAGEGWWLFGERGLAAVDRPVMIIVATRDPLYGENALIFSHMGATDKSLVSFVGPEHLMIYNTDMVARMAHFAAAFFGYHLQGQEDLKYYYSEEWVAQQPDLAWGVYSDD
jgi:hypothetical protein